MKHSKLFRKFFISYIFILLLPLVTGFISYHMTIQIAEDSSIKDSLSVLNQSKKVVEQRLEEVGNFTKQLAINDDVNRLLVNNELDGDGRVLQAMSLQQNLLSYASTNDYLQDSFIYFKNLQIVITPNSVYYRLKHFYELNNYDISYEQWKSMLDNNHHDEIIPLDILDRGKRDNLITYIQSLPINNYSKSYGTVVVQINDHQVNKFLDNIVNEYDGWAFVMDKDGKVLAQNGINNQKIESLKTRIDLKEDKTFQHLNNNETLLIQSKSDVNGWYYFAGIPKKSLMFNANKIKYVSWLVALVTLIIGLIICIWFAIKNSGPINSLVKVVRDYAGPNSGNIKDDIMYLHGNITSLLSKNKSLQNELKEQSPMLKEMFLYQFVQGNFQTEVELAIAAKQAEVDIPKAGYVGILRVHGYGEMNSPVIYNELNAARIISKRKLENMGLNLLVTKAKSDQLIFIFPTDELKRETMIKEMKDRFENVSNQIKKEYNIVFTITIGSYFESSTAVSLSYNHAIQVMDYTRFMNIKGILCYENSEKQSNMYDYTIDQELRLLNAMKMGDTKQAMSLLEQVFKQNFHQKHLSVDMVNQLIDELKATYLKALNHYMDNHEEKIVDLKNKVKDIQLTEGLDKIRLSLEVIGEQFCSLVIKQKNALDNELVQAIIEYLEESYHNSELTLYQVSEVFKRSEKHVAQLFKSQTGIYIMDYLEKIRMNKASDLLANTELTIEAISSQVGYNSSHSFRRAFKRILNVTPNQYRTTLSNNERSNATL